MSTSSDRRRAAAAGPRLAIGRGGATMSQRHAPPPSLPPTVSRAALLEDGSDRRFRQLVYDLFTIAARMEAAREHLAARMGVTTAQYSIMMTIAQLQGEVGVGVGALAKTLHVSSAFVASESGKLARLGLVTKRPNPSDGRGVLLRLTRAGRQRIARVGPHVRAVNDMLFAALDRPAFEGLSVAAAGLVHGSEKVVQWLRLVDAEPPREAAE
jgi:DNA-binding MarR family transcriptional regulator